MSGDYEKNDSLAPQHGGENPSHTISTKARLLWELRKKQGPVSGNLLAKELGLSRVAVWKAAQTLINAGYKIEASETGYFLDPKSEKDFLFPWEFLEKEPLFRHHDITDSTMDRAREAADQGAPSGTVIIAEKQSLGRGRNGRAWISRQGGLFFTLLDRPSLSISDYPLYSLILQIATAQSLSAICGKQAFLRWPNDIYIDGRKIAGVMTEISGEGDLINWITGGIGVNVNNYALSGKTTSCAEITGREVSRKEVLLKIFDEIEKLKKQFAPDAAYSQGNRALAAEWNSLSCKIGAAAAIVDETSLPGKERVLARGVFDGIDPGGRAILKTVGAEGGQSFLYFSPGPASMVF